MALKWTFSQKRPSRRHLELSYRTEILKGFVWDLTYYDDTMPSLKFHENAYEHHPNIYTYIVITDHSLIVHIISVCVPSTIHNIHSEIQRK